MTARPHTYGNIKPTAATIYRQKWPDTESRFGHDAALKRPENNTI